MPALVWISTVAVAATGVLPPSPTACVPTMPNASAWVNYLAAVYHERLPDDFQYDLSGLTWVYHGVHERWCPGLPDVVRHARLPPGTAFALDRGRENSALNTLMERGFFIQRDDMGPSAQSRDSWVEVIRVRRPKESSFFRHTTWFYAARGTGVHINLGRTTVHEYVDSWTEQRRIVRSAQRRGYDSLQFRHGYGLNMTEIVLLRTPSTTTTCGAGIQYHTGFRATIPCTCSETSDILNCDAPTSEGVAGGRALAGVTDSHSQGGTVVGWPPMSPTARIPLH
mmetsp:Transcript_12704/g.43002  ORF Transcript_12704/g.43002 Transcript_12704/m.43002 type:complete len:282 (+) Transcript_12704:107-952(+)